MHKLKLLTKPVSKNWSMEKNGTAARPVLIRWLITNYFTLCRNRWTCVLAFWRWRIFRKSPFSGRYRLL